MSTLCLGEDSIFSGANDGWVHQWPLRTATDAAAETAESAGGGPTEGRVAPFRHYSCQAAIACMAVSAVTHELFTAVYDTKLLCWDALARGTAESLAKPAASSPARPAAKVAPAEKALLEMVPPEMTPPEMALASSAPLATETVPDVAATAAPGTATASRDSGRDGPNGASALLLSAIAPPLPPPQSPPPPQSQLLLPVAALYPAPANGATGNDNTAGAGHDGDSMDLAHAVGDARVSLAPYEVATGLRLLASTLGERATAIAQGTRDTITHAPAAFASTFGGLPSTASVLGRLSHWRSNATRPYRRLGDEGASAKKRMHTGDVQLSASRVYALPEPLPSGRPSAAAASPRPTSPHDSYHSHRPTTGTATSRRSPSSPSYWRWR